MSSYFLNAQELSSITLFCGCLKKSHNPNYAKLITTYEEDLIKDLLIKRPDLIPLNEEFKANIQLHKFPHEYWASLFNNKISIEDFSSQIFTNSYLYFGEQRNRANLFNELNNKSPKFIELIHNHLKNTSESDQTIYYSYFKFLKDKKTNKSSLQLDDILNNINKFRPISDDAMKRKILAYLAVSSKNEKTYELISEQFQDIFKKNATIKLFWEEKLNLFPEYIIQKYKNEKENMNVFTEDELFYYKFQLNAQALVEKGIQPLKKAEGYTQQIHNSIKTFINKTFKCSSVHTNYNTPLVAINFSSEKDRSEAKYFCRLLVKNIDLILDAIQKSDNFYSQQEQLQELFDKICFADQLENKLKKDDSASNKRMKI